MNEFEVKYCTANLMKKASRSISRELDKALKGKPIKGTQFSLLNTIDYFGGTSMSKLSEVIGLERTTLTRNLSVLEREGLVKTQTDENDSRIRLVEITPKGKDLIENSFEQWLSFQKKYVGELGKDEWMQFIQMLIKIAKV